MKKILALFVSLLFLIGGLFSIRFYVQQQEVASNDESQEQRQPLYLFNWGNYIDPDLISKFEEQTNYKIIYETFDSNDAMEAKLKQGGTTYDLILPSASSIPKLIEQDLLLPLDHTKLKGLDTISPFLMDTAQDPKNKFTIPYFWGTIGLMVNTDLVDISRIDSWESLWQEDLKNEILLIDGNRETLGVALQSLGYSQNTTNQQELLEARQKLTKLIPNVRAVLMEEIKTLMLQNEAAIGMGYSGDAAYVNGENPAIQYVLPKYGGAIWTDNFAIPYTAKNIQGAYHFINFMLEPEHAAQNAEYVGYAIPVEPAKDLLPKEVTEDRTFYPTAEDIKHMEQYEYLGREWIDRYNEQFLAFKMEL